MKDMIMSGSAGFKKSSRRLAAGLVLSLAFSSSAFALNQSVFIGSIQGAMRPYGLTLNYKKSEIEGDNLTLKNARLMQKEDGRNLSVPIYLGTVIFSNIKTESGDSFTIDRIEAGKDSRITADITEKNMDKATALPGRIIVHDINILRAHIGPAGKTHIITEYLPYQNVTVKNITYQAQGKTTLSLDDIKTHYEKKDDGAFENTSQIASFTYDPASWPGQDGQNAKNLLDSLGYDKIHGNFSAKGLWNPQNGRLDIAEYKFTADTMGSLIFTGKLGGITQKFTNTYQKLALQQAEDKKTAPEKRQQLNQDILALASQLDFGDFTLTYKDNSLTGRILDYMSKSSAIARQELVSLMKAAVLQNTQNFRDTAFADHAAEQINAFLDNPQSFRITARPQKPVPFSSILLALGLAPEQLINLLGLDVAANK